MMGVPPSNGAALRSMNEMCGGCGASHAVSGTSERSMASSALDTLKLPRARSFLPVARERARARVCTGCGVRARETRREDDTVLAGFTLSRSKKGAAFYIIIAKLSNDGYV